MMDIWIHLFNYHFNEVDSVKRLKRWWRDRAEIVIYVDLAQLLRAPRINVE